MAKDAAHELRSGRDLVRGRSAVGKQRPIWLVDGVPHGIIRVAGYTTGDTHLSRLNRLVVEDGVMTKKVLLWPACLELVKPRASAEYARVMRAKEGRVCLGCLEAVGLPMEDPV